MIVCDKCNNEGKLTKADSVARMMIIDEEGKDLGQHYKANLCSFHRASFAVHFIGDKNIDYGRGKGIRELETKHE